MLQNRTILLTLFASIILLPGLIGLGTWQLHRATFKQRIQDDYSSRLHASPLTKLPSEYPAPHPDLQFYPLNVTGHFLNDRQFLLDNRSYQLKPGVEVVTPFVPDNGQPAILVDRGWLPYGKNRQDLPKIPPIQGTIHITGILTIPSHTLILSTQEENSTLWPRIIQRLEIDKAAKALNLPLQNYILMVKSESPYAFKVNWAPIVVPPERHIAYAVQWYALAIVWVIISFIVIFKSRSRRS